MHSRFEMTLMEEMKFFLGLQIHQSPRGILINQAKYALEMLKKHGVEKYDTVGTPMATKPKLDADLSGKLIDQTDYHMKMEILPESTSNSSEVGDSSKLNLLDHRLVLTEPEVNPTKFGRMTSQYEHVGQDTRSQGGKDDQDKQGKDLEISKSKTKSKDNDKGSRLKITQHEGTSIQHNKDQRFKNSTTKQSQQVQGSKIQDLTLGILRPHIMGDC
ncbi:hypothetical protein Tco_1133155 [Tanacetum coccineum]|uniref:Reverse transcriptase Ty1/copia-type domain-containing protein n=1 Tax=Tanacetum coccineum TaxID=301880 RepID=A0ABQ5JEL0_9ASTR